jgi:hypothetical protein
LKLKIQSALKLKIQSALKLKIQSAFHEKVPGGGVWRRLWCGSEGEKFTGGWTKGLLLVENSMMHHGVTPLHTD